MNVWAIQSLVTGFFYLILGLFVFSKGPRRRLNRYFSLFAICFAIWSLTEAVHRSTAHPSTAYFWIRLGGLGWCFMMSFYFDFILAFARKENLSKSLTVRMCLYFPPIVLFYLFLTTDLIYKQDVVKEPWGFTSMPGNLVWVYMGYYLLLYSISVFYLVKILRTGGDIEKKQAKPILLGCTTALVIGTATNVALPALNIPTPELGTLVSMTWMLCTLYAVRRYKLFIIEPSSEERRNKEAKYRLSSGKSYLVVEEKPEKGYEIFIDQLATGRFGLCLSKTGPSKVKERYGLIRTPIIWLTFSESKDEKAVSPKDTDALESTIQSFLGKVDKSVVFMDCFSEIRLANGCDAASSWLERIKKKCSEQDCILLISTNPLIFEANELSMIKRNTEVFV